MKKTELLIPVGNKETLIAAINNGADAVYLGGKKFGARAYAENFTNDEIIEAIKLCHLYDVKIYVTVNTMIYNEEIQEAIDYLKFLYQNNVDAVIMQDLGLIQLTRKLLPDLEIHVSTQAHNHNESSIRYFKEIGCKRVVFDRESSLNSINSINTDIEKEIFVYGALCICYSGNCLFSALNGGRSANRGMCVGSCRLPYKLIKNNQEKDSGYLLSTKDLNVLPKLKEILDSKIDSLKVEGRMKSKEYVAVITRTFRKLIDAYYSKEPLTLSEDDAENLLKTYNREFTLGYLFNEKNIINKKTSNHQGIKIGTVVGVNNKKITIKLDKDLHQEDAIRFEKTNTGMYINCLYNEKQLLVNEIKKGNICQVDNKDRIMYDKLIDSSVLKTVDSKLNKEINNIPNKKNKINISFTAFTGQEAKLTIKDKTNTITVTKDIVKPAINQPITKQNIIDQLSKLGNTAFEVDSLNIDISSNIFINLKDLNNLRREAIALLTTLKEGKPKDNFSLNLKYPIKKSKLNKKYSILTRNEEQLVVALKHHFDYIYVTDENLYNKYKKYDNVYLRLNRVNETYKEYQNEKLLCTELGSLLKYSKNNIVRTDYYLNVANDFTINEIKKLGAEGITLSIELSTEQLKNIKNKQDSEIIIYSRPECMIIKNNIFDLNNEKCFLKNDKNQCFPVKIENNFTHIFLDKNKTLDPIIYKDFQTLRIELFTENALEAEKIITNFKK